MKRLFILCMLILPFQMQAQDIKYRSTDIYGGYGIITAQDMVVLMASTFGGVFSFGNAEEIKLKGLGAYFVGTDYYVSENFSLGGQINYSYHSIEYKLSGGATQHSAISFVSPMVRAKIDWGKYFYSALGAGVSFMKNQSGNDIERHIAPAFQISPIGFRTQGKLSFFAELGLGFQGLASVGLIYKL